MCGILGFLFKEIDKNQFKRATNLMRYRGPDDCGFWFDDCISLGHRRLSIIDLSKKGRQPMENEDGNLQIVFNGEIYNFNDIKRQLKGRHEFRSNSDTEVILHAYEDWGERCVSKLNGMFAFAIYNRKEKNLFIARDRAGIKPLYYRRNGENFIFSSEIKSILALGARARLNKKILYDYLNYQIMIGDETLFEEIYSFPPGHYAVVSRHKIALKKYWDADYQEKSLGERECADKLKKVLEESVNRQMVSDVPLGAFLSGGLDSSIIVALARQHSDNLKTFTAGFDVFPEEIGAAEFISKELGTDQHSVSVSSEMFIKELPKLIGNYDMPLSFASAVPLYFVSKMASNKVKVVLTGEGSDELFAGYRRYYLIQKAIQASRKIKNIPGARRLINAAKTIFIDPRYIKMIDLAANGENYNYFTGINSIIGKEREMLAKIESNDILKKKAEEIFNRKSASFTNRLLYLDFKTYLAELLMKQDKMSMAASIESRVPFLDNEVIDFANSIPSELKLNRGAGKYILKKTAARLLPEKVVNRKKIGFSVPLDIWFRKELRGYLKEELNDKVIKRYFNERYVDKLLKKQKTKNCSLQLWSLLNLKLWSEKYLSDD